MRKYNLPIYKLFFLLTLFSLSSLKLQAQDILQQAEDYLLQNLESLGLTASDLDNRILQDHYVTEKTGVHHIYWKQTIEGIPIESAILNVNIYDNGEILSLGNRFIPNIQQVPAPTQVIPANNAVSLAAQSLEIPLRQLVELSVSSTPEQKTLFAKGEIALESISAEKVYLRSGGIPVLSWKVEIYLKDASKWWSVYVDAGTGDILQSLDKVLHCSFDHDHAEEGVNQLELAAPALMHAKPFKLEKITAPDSYRVYPLGIESPNHGARSLVVNPAYVPGSPYGWHDTNGADGGEFTHTQGNNVWAREDRDANNTGGFSPDGGISLDFDFSLDLNQDPTDNSPAENESAAITNLFYWNNIIHDIFYQYGFDEPAGNFQENNYGNGGIDGDFVFADAQDGAGLNNANFATPIDGDNPRMQMFLWGNSTTDGTVNVTSPVGIAGSYTSVADPNAPSIYNISEEIILADDGTTNGTELCGAAVNGGDLAGKIALIDESGSCDYYDKVINAQNEGALAVIIIKDGPGAPTSPNTGIWGLFFVDIPAVMVSEVDGNLIKSTLNAGTSVFATLKPDGDFLDGDFDNGIIAHEYGHGISIRLTGGPGDVGCLQNEEQAGEGWSDWFGIVLTHDPSHTSSTARGIGTFALEEPITGTGIRTYPYSTDMSVNPHTYDDIKDPSLSVPHGVGSVFGVMLYDLYWNLIDQHGYDPDLYAGSGGNNIAIQLVIDGLKLQPCSPGFVDMRDAILAADQANYGGANEALIWQTFARRGLGYSATQGNTNDRTDGSEAFDLPPSVFPVELISFTAQAGQDAIMLNWETSLEQNNKGFEIQRFVEASQTFESIGWMPGAGTTDLHQKYHLTDDKVLPGKTYVYRLKQIDFNGQYSYSRQVQATLESQSQHAVYLYPNPLSSEQLYLEIIGRNVAHEWSIVLYDALGREVYKENISYTNQDEPISLEIKDLGPGIYTLKARSAGYSFTEKLIKR